MKRACSVILLASFLGVLFSQPNTLLQLPGTIQDDGQPCNPAQRGCVQVQLPEASSIAFNGSYAVASQRQLRLQGTGTLLDTGFDAPASWWDQQDFHQEGAPAFLVSAGAHLEVHNITMLNMSIPVSIAAVAGSTTSALLPSTIALDDPWLSSIKFQNVVWHLHTCDMLVELQEYICGMMVQESSIPWPVAEMEEGWLFVWRLYGYRANITLERVLISCTWPPPALIPVPGLPPDNGPFVPFTGTASVSPAAAAFANDTELAAGFIRLDANGYPVAGWVDANGNPFITPGSSRLSCAARRVSTYRDMLQAVAQLQAMSSRYVVVRLVANLSLADVAWDQGRALRVFRNLTLMGRLRGQTELDFDVHRHVFWLDVMSNTTQLRLQRLTLTNLPLGPYTAFPNSVLVSAVWAVAWDRPASGERQLLVLKNSTLIVPPDTLNFTAYWAGIQASPVASVRALGAWQAGLAFKGSSVTDVVISDAHTLFLSSRSGQGMLWSNTTVTDTPLVAPARLSSSGLGQLVPGDPYFPYAYLTGVYNTVQLVTYLQSPPTPVLILMSNLTLNSSVFTDAADGVSDVDDHGAGLGEVTDNGAPGRPAQPRLGSSGRGGKDVMPQAMATRPITVLGHWARPTLLDLGGLSGALQVNISPSDTWVAAPDTVAGPGQAAGITLGRLTLSGLAPGDPSDATNTPALVNITSNLYFFRYPRQRQSGQLLLSNVTLVVPQPELQLLLEVVALRQIPQQGPAIPVASNTLIDLLNNSWGGTTLLYETENSFQVDVVSFNGWQGYNITVSSTPQFTPNGSSITPPAAVTLSVGMGGGPGEPQLGSTTSQGGSTQRGLHSWKVGVIAASAVLGAALLGALAAVILRRRTRARERAQHSSQHAYSQDLEDGEDKMGELGPHALIHTGLTPGTYSSGGPGTASPAAQPSLSSHSGRRSGSHSAGQAGVVASSVSMGRPSSGRPSANMGRSGSTSIGAVGGMGDVGSGGASGSILSQRNSGGSSQLRMGTGGTGDSQDRGPDDEIRQLVAVQRSRAGAARRVTGGGQSSGPRGVGGRAGPAGVEGGLEGVELDEVLGQGSFGVVYRGWWRGMQVAVKTITFHDAGPAARRARQRAINEAAINTLLSHDCICNMYAYELVPIVSGARGLPDDRFATNYRLYIIQEFCDAGSLAHAIDNGAFVEPATGARQLVSILQLACDIASGMAYIHDKSVVHGDMSTANVLLRRDPAIVPLGARAKVADFGMSRFLEGPEQSHISNARQGTPYYMAPEVLAHGMLSREADVFSFGVVLWELFHAQTPPWRDSEVLAAAAARLQMGRQGGARLPRMLPPTAVIAVLNDSPVDGAGAASYSPAATRRASAMRLGQAPEAVRQQAAGLGAEITSTGETVVILPRPMLALDPQSPSGFSYPLPPDCPPEYAALVAACLHPIPKVRPRMADAYATLYFLLRQSLAAVHGAAAGGQVAGQGTVRDRGGTIAGRPTDTTPPDELWRTHTTSTLLSITPAGVAGFNMQMGGGGRDSSPLSHLAAATEWTSSHRRHTPGAHPTEGATAAQPHGAQQQAPVCTSPLEHGASLPEWLGPGGLMRVGTMEDSRMGVSGGVTPSGSNSPHRVQADQGTDMERQRLPAQPQVPPTRMGTVSLFDSLSIDLHSSATNAANVLAAAGAGAENTGLGSQPQAKATTSGAGYTGLASDRAQGL